MIEMAAQNFCLNLFYFNYHQYIQYVTYYQKNKSIIKPKASQAIDNLFEAFRYLDEQFDQILKNH